MLMIKHEHLKVWILNWHEVAVYTAVDVFVVEKWYVNGETYVDTPL